MAYYHYKAEKWDLAKCEKMSKKYGRDGLGTRDPFPGRIPMGYISCIGGYGTTRYNGGTVIDNEWYEGIVRPLPEVPPEFAFVQVSTWGWRIIKKSS